MSNNYEDPFSLDGILPEGDDQKLPKLKVPVKVENPFDDEESPKHKVERSCAERKVHTSSRLKKGKAVKPAGPPKQKSESKGHGGKRIKGVVHKEDWKNQNTATAGYNDDIAERRAKSMDVAKRIITEAIRQATYTISEEFVRSYGKSFKAMKKDMIEAIHSGAEKAKDEVIRAIEGSTVSIAQFKQE